MLRNSLLLSLVLSCSCFLVPRVGLAQGLQIDFGALAATPVGEFQVEGVGDVDASDVLDTGFGLIADVLYGVNENLFVGGGIGVYLNDGGSFFDLAGVDAEVTSIPIHAIVQFRSPNEASFGFFGEGGLGITSHSAEVSAFGESSSDSQSSFSFLLGGGVFYRLSDSWRLTSGARYHQAVTGDGDVWEDGDNPKQLLFSLGASWNRGQ